MREIDVRRSGGARQAAGRRTIAIPVLYMGQAAIHRDGRARASRRERISVLRAIRTLQRGLIITAYQEKEVRTKRRSRVRRFRWIARRENEERTKGTENIKVIFAAATH